VAFQDKTLICKDCGSQFSFTAREQEFYAQKNFSHEPARCKDCRAKRRPGGPGQSGISYSERPMFDVICSACGVQTQVSFKPTPEKPVYGRDCFQKNRRKS
jgi:CxxC-x17-CxxC domain-containing protein